ncbi:hypothetical protein LOZ65_003193, partial [Ophidiomyces ophidiicola]
MTTIILLTPGAPETAPKCYLCGRKGVLKITRASNRNGNAGRPYYKCLPCNKFLTFNDLRGNDPKNPQCFCGTSSKLQISGLDKKVPRGLHYVCRLGRCGFYDTERRGQMQLTVDEDLVDLLIR